MLVKGATGGYHGSTSTGIDAQDIQMYDVAGLRNRLLQTEKMTVLTALQA